MRSPLAYALVLLGLTSGCREPAREKQLRIAAAADLAKAFTEIGAEFERDTGIHTELTFGSSGLLARQVEQGAPFSLFAAANRAFVDQVVATGKCDGATAQLYGRGRVVVWTPKGKVAPKTLAELAEPRFARIALANPEHAPYGAAAKQALQRAGVWGAIESKLVLAENVQATMLYARDGNADVALVALSLAVVADGGSFLPIDDALHAPLDQALVVCGSGPEAAAARQFAAYVRSPEGVEVMTRYGFSLPAKPQ